MKAERPTVQPAVELVSPERLPGALRSAISVAKAHDPLAPVWVVIPSAFSGVTLSRAIARAGGVANVRFVTLSHLAELLLSESARSEHATPRLTDDVRHEITRQVATTAETQLQKSMSPASVRALTKLFANLRSRSDAEVEHIASSNALASELVRLYRRFRSIVSGRFVDSRDMIECATAEVSQAGANVVAVIVDPPDAHETAMLEALADAGRLSVVAAQVGEATLDDAVRTWLWGMGEARSEPVVERLPDRIVIAPDPDVEVQLAISELLQNAERGVPFSSMALLYGNSDTYALTVAHHLSSAGIPWTGKAAMDLRQSAAGRFVQALLHMVRDDVSLTSMSAWLATAPIRHPETREGVPQAEWMRIARKARVGDGIEQWRTRLGAYIDSHQRGSHDGIDAARALSSFVADFAGWANAPRSSWLDWASWLQSGIDRYLGNHDERITWPRNDAQSATDVEQALATLSKLDEVGTGSDDVTADVFIAALERQLERQRFHSSPGGVFTGTLSSASGASFEVTAICGLAEGITPAPLERDGIAAAVRVPGEELQSERTRRALLVALGATRRSVLYSPRADQRGQRERRPSPWLIELASRLARRGVTASEIVRGNAEWNWLEIVPSFTHAITEYDFHASRQLDVVAGLARWTSAGLDATAFMADENGQLPAGMIAIKARDGDEMTRFDGNVESHASLRSTFDESLIPTDLEHWAVCPYRYFLRSVLHVEENEEDDDPFRTAPRDRGSLVHRALEQFIKQAPPRTSPDQPWTTSERQLLHDITDELLRAAQESGHAPRGLLSKLERDSLHGHLDALLDDDEATRHRRQQVPVGVEVPFGIGPAPSAEVNRANGQRVTFRGRMDRVDRALDGTSVSVIDYKTGRRANSPELEDDRVAAGSKLQLAVYAEAAAEVNPDAHVTAEYWFVTDEASGYSRQRIPLDDRTRTQLVAAVDSMATGIENGVFPAVSGGEDGRGSFVNCHHCPYDGVCLSDRDEAWTRKLTDPVIEPFHALSSVEDA